MTTLFSHKILKSKDWIQHDFDDAEKAREVRKRVLKKLPDLNDVASNPKYYIWTWIHHIIYTIFLVGGYYYQSIYWKNEKNMNINIFGLYEFNININLIISYLISIPMAWGYVGVFLGGHDAEHQQFAPKRTWYGHLMNKACEVLILDFLGASSYHAFEIHDYHHNYTNATGDYEMISLNYGCGELGEVFHVVRLYFGWLIDDIVRVLNIPANYKQIPIMYRTMLAIGIIFRVSIVMCGGYFSFIMNNDNYTKGDFEYTLFNTGTYDVNMQFRPDISVSNVFWIAAVFSYIFFSPHYNPIKPEQAEKVDVYIWTLRNTYETYVGWGWYENFQMLLHCGITMHATHHLFPFLPRSLMYIPSVEMLKAYPNEVRNIQNMYDDFGIWWNRKVFAWPSQLHDYWVGKED